MFVFTTSTISYIGRQEKVFASASSGYYSMFPTSVSIHGRLDEPFDLALCFGSFSWRCSHIEVRHRDLS